MFRMMLVAFLVFSISSCSTVPNGQMGASAIKSEEQSATLVLGGYVVAADEVISNGWLVVQDGKIISIRRERPDIPGARVLATDDWIFPGMVDLHNHPLYNVFPRWLPPVQYDNRYAWRGDAAYKNAIQTPSGPLFQDNFCDVNAFAEIKLLIGGTTATLGISKPRALPEMPQCIAGLIRNLDWFTGFNGPVIGKERIRTALGVAQDMNDGQAKDLLDALNSNAIDLLAIHVAEGKQADTQSKSEFGLLVSRQLLTSRTAVVHGLALSATDFAQLKTAGGALIWSPRSNLELYGETADVAAAQQAGVTVVLAPDWSPTGSSSLLAELVYASNFNKQKLGGLFSPKTLFEMTTLFPARVARIDDKVGSLTPGKYADLFLLRRSGADPYEDVTRARPQDVTLGVVNGVPLYGARDRLGELGVRQTEAVLICGEDRGLNSAAITVDSLAAASARIAAKLRSSNINPGLLAECN